MPKSTGRKTIKNIRNPYSLCNSRIGRKITYDTDDRVIPPLDFHLLSNSMSALEKRLRHILPQHDIRIFIQTFLFRERTPFDKIKLMNLPITSIYKSKRKCLTYIIYSDLSNTIIIHEIIFFFPDSFHQPSRTPRVYASNIPSFHILKSVEHDCPITIHKRSLITGCIIHKLKHDNNEHECKCRTNHAKQSVHFIMFDTTQR